MSNSSDRSSKSRQASSWTKGISGILRGRIGFGRATLEAFRRGRVTAQSRRERALLDELASQPARLRPEFDDLPLAALLQHFRERSSPSFFTGLAQAESTGRFQRRLFPRKTERLIESARLIARDHRWSLLGFGEQNFGPQINWHRDPLSGRAWPLDYHADIPLWHNDGSDIRVLWELNRLGHLLTLARAYALTGDEDLAAEFFAQLDSWCEQNPVGRGANWSCAMEVALRAMNLLAAFSIFLNSPKLNEERLVTLLAMFDQHGAHIRRNLEFSHLATSNHYLADIAGLLWLGIMLPELKAAAEWRKWALSELLREMDKQILPDGADYESATGYHCLVLELFLYSFVLCRANEISIAEKYWRKLHSMLVYLRDILRPDGLAPLIGDSDGGRLLPMGTRDANDQAYLLALGATIFNDDKFKLAPTAGPEELLWLLGEAGVQDYERLANSAQTAESRCFSDAGTYILRQDNLFLIFNANAALRGRPASHRHNDLLSIEISVGDTAFITDPGTYVYTANLRERRLFRSTAYHSTIQIDDEEQRVIREEEPFAFDSEAAARVLLWESRDERDRVVAEHTGYQRLSEPVTHRRTITFDKTNRWWLVEDEISGSGTHKIAARFHFNSGLQVNVSQNHVVAEDKSGGTRLFLCPLDLDQSAKLETQFTSRNYGCRAESVSAYWTVKATMPFQLRWAIVPVCAGERPEERLKVVQSPMSKVQRPLTGWTSDIGRWTLD